MSNVLSQSIPIDSAFTADGVIYPFNPGDTIYGLSISGTVTLYSDTSLVRIILIGENGEEFMAYEAYPMIVTQYNFDVTNESDETCYLNDLIPLYINIQIIDAEFAFDSIVISYQGQGDLEALQYQEKRNKDLEKVQIMNQNITLRGWNWTAGDNELLAKYYKIKSLLFGYQKYNIQGFDYHIDGVFYYSCSNYITSDGSVYNDSFDWRSKHNADIESSNYYDPDGNGWITDFAGQGDCGACWVFGPVASVEAVINLYFNQHVNYNLSEQEVLCCAPGTGDCTGGYPSNALYYIYNYGVPDENCYLYIQYHDDECCVICPDSPPEYRIRTSGNPVLPPGYYSVIDSIKGRLINRGPLPFYIDSDNLRMNHVMSLIGYYTGDNNVIKWIFKDSDINGYGGIREMTLGEGDIEQIFSIKTPIIEEEPVYSIECLDKDLDGYKNWGIGSQGECLACDPSLAEDSNDDDNRIGPYDENYYGMPVKPEMKVCWYRGEMLERVYVENNVFFIVNDEDLVTINNIYVFRIENPGNAQLNLPQYTNPITSSDEVHFSVDHSGINVAICQNDGYTDFTVTFDDQGSNEPLMSVIEIYVSENDIDNFKFGMLYNGCQYSEQTLPITSNETWPDFRSIQDDIHVQAGITLTITGSVAMAEGASIFVDSEAELVVDGGLITSGCDRFWNGVDVWGDNTKHQCVTYQGIIRVINGGSIEFAEVAIETGKYLGSVYTPSGGIVNCNDAILKDNRIGVRFFPYRNYHPVTGDDMYNLSRLKKTDMVITQDFYNLDYTPNQEHQYGIYLYDVNGIGIEGCSFSNQSDMTGVSRGTGIYSCDAGYDVRKTCLNTNQVPCQEYKPCNFAYLDYGIRDLSHRNTRAITVDSAVFIDNYTVVFISGTANPFVIRNQFLTLDNDKNLYANNDPLVGLYLEYTSGYQVEENTFSGGYVSSGDQQSVGIHILNSGPEFNEIYNNEFNDNYVGIIAAGENRAETGEGLCLKCNDFAHCPIDIYITPEGGYYQNNLGIAENQGELSTNGEPDLATGNTFSDFTGQDNNYYNDPALNQISYFHHKISSTDEKIQPFPFLNINLIQDFQANYQKELSCPSHLNNGGIDIQFEMSTMESETIQITAYQDTINQVVDGGDTESLNSDVQVSLPYEALQVRQQLLGESPNLSDTVMISTINQENVLPNAMIRDILVANPHSSKTTDVMNALDERQVPMPDSLMAEIMQGLSIYSAYELLTQKLAHHKAVKAKSFRKLIRYYKNDTANISTATDSLINLYQNETSLQSNYNLVFTYLDLQDSASLFSTLSNIPIEFTLNNEQQTTHNSYENLFTTLINIPSDSIVLDSMQIATLNLLAQDSLILPGVFARNILVTYKLINYREPIYLPDYLKSMPVWKVPDKSSQGQKFLKIFPNPAGNYIIASYNLESTLGEAQLKINDISGRLIKRISLKGVQNQIVISMEDVSHGTLIISLLVNNTVLENHKVNIVK